MRHIPHALHPVLFMSVLVSAASLVACKSDPPPKPVEQVSISAQPGDDDSAHETGNEGDDDVVLTSAATAAQGAGGSALLSEANRIVGRVRASTYSHKTRVDEGAGEYDLDCSGLVDYALSRVCPDALETVPRNGPGKRPLAKHFVELIDGLQPGQKKARWKRVGKASELLPGDVVAWLKPADVVSNNTGHIMIVRAPVTAEHGEVTVPIIDSTSMRHGADDSRFASKATGVGIGTIHLIVNEAGAPTGYRWSNGKKAHNHSSIVALGRIE